MFVLVLLSLIGGALSSVNNLADVPCGKTKFSRTGKIVGGQDATEGEFPWLVSITRRGGHFCGGSIITKNHVLTAAHCMCGGAGMLEAAQLRVTVSQHNLKGESENKFEMAVKSITVHPEYDCRKVKSDVAVLELDRELRWSEFVGPACLPMGIEEEGYSKFDETLATVAGWGWTNEDNQKGGRADTLQKAEVKVIPTQTCRDWYKSQGKKTKIQDGQICAGHEQGGIDACWADSGGPLMVSSKSGIEVILVGVVSTGIGCARPYLPGLYTRLSEYVPWIKSVTSQ